MDILNEILSNEAVMYMILILVIWVLTRRVPDDMWDTAEEKAAQTPNPVDDAIVRIGRTLTQSGTDSPAPIASPGSLLSPIVLPNVSASPDIVLNESFTVPDSEQPYETWHVAGSPPRPNANPVGWRWHLGKDADWAWRDDEGKANDPVTSDIGNGLDIDISWKAGIYRIERLERLTLSAGQQYVLTLPYHANISYNLDAVDPAVDPVHKWLHIFVWIDGVQVGDWPVQQGNGEAIATFWGNGVPQKLEIGFRSIWANSGDMSHLTFKGVRIAPVQKN